MHSAPISRATVMAVEASRVTKDGPIGTCTCSRVNEVQCTFTRPPDG